jgi:hypothetical protein
VTDRSSEQDLGIERIAVAVVIPRARARGSGQASEIVVERRTACLDGFGEIGAWLWGIPHTAGMFHGLTYTVPGMVVRGERQY